MTRGLRKSGHPVRRLPYRRGPSPGGHQNDKKDVPHLHAKCVELGIPISAVRRPWPRLQCCVAKGRADSYEVMYDFPKNPGLRHPPRLASVDRGLAVKLLLKLPVLHLLDQWPSAPKYYNKGNILDICN